MYAMILVDGEYADSYATLHMFDDKALWDWMHTAVDFGDVSSVPVDLPVGFVVDGRTCVTVTVGSPENDKAQVVSGLVGTVEVVVDEESLDEDDFDEAYDTVWRQTVKDLCAVRGVTDVYEGLWY